MAEWWNETPLDELSGEQWEALCDGCARCCLHKLEDEDDGEVVYTGVRCRYLDEASCRCSDYANRSRLVARIQSPSHCASRIETSVAASSTCSQLSMTSSIGCLVA